MRIRSELIRIKHRSFFDFVSCDEIKIKMKRLARALFFSETIYITLVLEQIHSPAPPQSLA